MAAAAGRVELIIGPMFSEKTTELMARARRAALAGRAVLVVKHASDTRYEAAAVAATHSGLRLETAPATTTCAAIRVVAARSLAEVAPGPAELVVAVDEGQFFPDLLERCDAWAWEGRRVIVAALDGDAERRPFGQVCALIPRSESLTKRAGVCMRCQADHAAFSVRLRPLPAGAEGPVQVGGREAYAVVCRACYGREN